MHEARALARLLPGVGLISESDERKQIPETKPNSFIAIYSDSSAPLNQVSRIAGL